MLVLNLKFNQAARLETTFNHQNSFTGTKVREQLVSTPEQSFSVHHDDVPYLFELLDGCRSSPWLLLSSLVLAVAATTTSASPLREKPPYVPEAEIHSRNFLQESRSAVGSPLDVEPFHYDLYIQPSIEEGTFTGFVNISFTALLKVSHVSLVFLERISPYSPYPLPGRSK